MGWDLLWCDSEITYESIGTTVVGSRRVHDFDLLCRSCQPVLSQREKQGERTLSRSRNDPSSRCQNDWNETIVFSNTRLVPDNCAK